MRRNTIVRNKNDNGPWSPFGRVTRRIDATHVEVIDCGKIVRICDVADLEVHNEYKGFRNAHNGRFYRMPTLRRLKQMAARYDKTVWRKFRDPSQINT
jgi:hypothetical protein